MKKKIVCLGLGMLVFVAGCGEEKSNVQKTTETVSVQESFVETDIDTKEETEETKDLADQDGVDTDQEESESIDGQETVTQEFEEEILSYQNVKLSGKADTDFEILSVASGDAGAVVKVDFSGEEKTLALDFEYDGYAIDLSSYEFEIADVDQDGKDDVLVKMYFPNNIVETLHLARLYHVENGEFVLWSDLNKEFVDEVLYLDESKIEASKVTLVTFYVSYDSEGEKIVCDDTIVLSVVDGKLAVTQE